MRSLTAPEWYDESGNSVKPTTRYIHTVKMYARDRLGATDSAFITIITSSSAAITDRGTFIQCLKNNKGKIVAVSGYRDDGNTHYLYCGYSNNFGSDDEQWVLNNNGLYLQGTGGEPIRFSNLTNELYIYTENGPVMQIL